MNKLFIMLFLTFLTCMQVSSSMDLEPDALEKAIQKRLIQLPPRPNRLKQIIIEPSTQNSTVENQLTEAFATLKNKGFLLKHIQSCKVECEPNNRIKIRKIFKHDTSFEAIKDKIFVEGTTKLPEGRLVRIEVLVSTPRKTNFKANL